VKNFLRRAGITSFLQLSAQCEFQQKKAGSPIQGNPAVSYLSETRGFPSPPLDGFGFVMEKGPSEEQTGPHNLLSPLLMCGKSLVKVYYITHIFQKALSQLRPKLVKTFFF
jgi:hypothetical protein